MKKRVGRLRRRFRSVSFRAGLVTATIVGLILGFLAFVTSASILVGGLYFGSEDNAVSMAGDVASRISRGENPAHLSAIDIFGTDDPSPEARSHRVVVVVNENASEVVYRSGPLPKQVEDSLFQSEELSALWGSNVSLTGRVKWSLATEDSIGADGDRYVIVVSDSTPGRKNFFFLVFGAILWGIVLVGATVSGVVSAWLVRISLRRVDRMQTELRRIHHHEMHRRLPTNQADDAIERLAVTMNETLARLEASSEQQNRFLADASHELRTPLAGMLVQLEVAKAYPDRADYDELIKQLLVETRRSQQLVEDLLLLSKLEATELQPSEPPLPISLVELIEAEAQQLRTLHPDLLVVVSTPEQAKTVGSADRWRRVIRNLLTNAARHATGSVLIQVRIRRLDVQIDVIDDGHGIDPSDRQIIFDRFVRLDDARNREEGGSGLGLAITAKLLESFGARILVLEPSISGYPGAHLQVLTPRKGAPSSKESTQQTDSHSVSHVDPRPTQPTTPPDSTDVDNKPDEPKPPEPDDQPIPV